MIALAVAKALSLTGLAAGVFIIAASDIVNGAIVAGVFSVVNTVINARILRRLARVEDTTAAAKRTARQGVRELHDLVDETRNGPK